MNSSVRPVGGPPSTGNLTTSRRNLDGLGRKIAKAEDVRRAGSKMQSTVRYNVKGEPDNTVKIRLGSGGIDTVV